MPRKKSVIFTIDCETDKFQYGEIPSPFCWGIYSPQFNDGHVYDTWGDSKSCTQSIVNYINSLPANSKIYAHNGGKFDFHFLLPHANREKIKVINGRIATMQIGDCSLIDSYLLLPFALEKYKKTKIDYNIFDVDKREKNKKQILNYLHDDCRDLYDLLTGFQKIVGQKLTIGGAAFAHIKASGNEIMQGSERHDETYRPYYYGGRVQAFKIGIFERPKNKNFYYIDINSAYPFAMLHDHPKGNRYLISKELPTKPGPWFAHIKAISNGCLPTRDEKGHLQFYDDNDAREYFATGWEICAGLKNNKLKILEVYEVREPQAVQNFKKFILENWKLRQAAKKAGDKIGDLAYKTRMNSGYGKYATDPRDFCDWELVDYGGRPEKLGENFEWHSDIGAISLFKCNSYDGKGFYDVAVGASITGFVRAYLFDALCNVKNPHYCDTDSILCEDYNNKLKIGGELGEWDIEQRVSFAAIAGKKLYTLKIGEKSCVVDKTVKHADYCKMCENDKTGQNCEKVWKTASKGVILTSKQLIQIAGGEVLTVKRDAPNFSIKHGVRFIERTIRSTSNVKSSSKSSSKKRRRGKNTGN